MLYENSGFTKGGNFHILHIVFKKHAASCGAAPNHPNIEMPTIRQPRLVRPDVLSRLKRSSIVALLSPYSDYFSARGAPLTEINNSETSLDAVVSVIASPVETTPPELVERLELLDLISDPQSAINFEDGYGDLVAKFRENDDTAADLAVKILIHAPEIAWREFDRQALQAKRSHVSFRVRQGLTFLAPTDRRIDDFRALVIPWFEANARSGICHVHVREEANGVAFVIRHGDMLKRIGIYDEDGKAGSRILRPERLDVAHYRYLTGEWQISGIGVKLQELYREAFGAVFHGSTNALVHSDRYSLEPLRDGPAILACDPASRIQFAELKSIKMELPGGQFVSIGNDHVFDGIHALNPQLLRTATLLEARIDLKIATRRRRAQVNICPFRDKVSGTHVDAAIDPWLTQRGFAHDPNEGVILASA